MRTHEPSQRAKPVSKSRKCSRCYPRLGPENVSRPYTSRHASRVEETHDETTTKTTKMRPENYIRSNELHRGIREYQRCATIKPEYRELGPPKIFLRAPSGSAIEDSFGSERCSIAKCIIFVRNESIIDDGV